LDDRLFPIIDIVKCALDRILLDGRPRSHNAIYQDFNIVFGDHCLRLDFHGVFADVADADNIHEWDLQSYTGQYKSVVSS
jgi:hypothetical protein